MWLTYTRTHDNISHKTVIFAAAGVRTSNLTCYMGCYYTPIMTLTVGNTSLMKDDTFL